MKSSYRDLVVWQRAMDLVDAVYSAVRVLPDHERFGLAAQMRRAAVSIPSNIAEGQGRSSPRQFRYFLHTARGSAVEPETEIIIAKRQKYLSSESAEALLTECARVSQLINGLLRHLRQRLTDNG